MRQVKFNIFNHCFFLPFLIQISLCLSFNTNSSGHSVFSVHSRELFFPSLSLYAPTRELTKLLSNLTDKFPGLAQFRQCKTAKQSDPQNGRNQDLRLDNFNEIQYLHIGNKNETHAVIVCNIHAREAITGDICVNWAHKWIQTLSQQQEQQKANQSQGRKKKTGNNGKIRRDFGIDLFYVANDNRDAAVVEGRCQRRSKSGIDLNRNFITEFNFYNVSKTSQIYSSSSPMSQPVTKCLAKIFKISQNFQNPSSFSQSPILFLDIHSGQNGGFFYQQGFNSRQDREILQILNKQICQNKCRLTTLARDGQAINGHIFASLKVDKMIKYSLLLEIYGDDREQNQDKLSNYDYKCLKEFNPVQKTQKRKIVNKWGKAINIVIQQVRRREKI